MSCHQEPDTVRSSAVVLGIRLRLYEPTSRLAESVPSSVERSGREGKASLSAMASTRRSTGMGLLDIFDPRACCLMKLLLKASTRDAAIWVNNPKETTSPQVGRKETGGTHLKTRASLVRPAMAIPI